MRSDPCSRRSEAISINLGCQSTSSQLTGTSSRPSGNKSEIISRNVQTMLSALKTRTLVIGNSGSGKSTLAVRIAEFAVCPVIDLDDIHWEENRASKKRDESLAIQMTTSITDEPKWVIEGVYGWLADFVTPRATALIWLNLPWHECKAGLERRGSSHGATDIQFNELLEWAQRYWTRQTSSSFAGHSKIFEHFRGKKLTLISRVDIEEFSKFLAPEVS